MKETSLINLIDNLKRKRQWLTKPALGFSQVHLEDYQGEAEFWVYSPAVIEGMAGLRI